MPVLTNYIVTTNDLTRLQPLGKTWLAKSGQTALDYETILELIAEKAHAHPLLVQKLNPEVNWTNIGGNRFENSGREVSRTGRQGGVHHHSSVGKISGSLRQRNQSARAFSVQHRGQGGKAACRRAACDRRSAQSQLHGQPGAFSRISGIAGARPQVDFAARSEQSGRRRVDWPGQVGLRDARHARAGTGRAHGIARLFPAGELGRGIFVAAGVGGFPVFVEP